MTALLTEHLPLVASAPNGVKKIRELILQLAVMGKLVPQDPGDEPASMLMERLRQNRRKWLTRTNSSESRTMLEKLNKIRPANGCFKTPDTWCFVRVIDCTRLMVDCHNKTAPYCSSGIPIIRTSNIRHRKFRFLDLRYVSPDTYEFWSRRCPPAAGDIIFTREAPMGEAAIIPEGATYCLGQRTMLIRPMHDFVDKNYLLLALTEPSLLERALPSAVGATVKHLRVGDVERLEVPLPPLAEQHRIVAKVDELMALCDRLDAQQSDAEAAHKHLVKALLNTLTQSIDQADFATSWERIKQNFDTIFTTESSIDALKQILLQLAVMGKLVPQDPTDEPASELLRCIADRRVRLIKEDGLRTQASAVASRNCYGPIPSSWALERLGNLAKFIDYRGKTPEKVEAGVPLITAKNVRKGFISREPREFITKGEYILWMTRGFPECGDLLFTTEAPLGNVAIVDISEEFGLAQRVICLQLHERKMNRFLLYALMSRPLQDSVERESTGMTAKGIKSSRLREIALPIPPLAEQRRIVAKVDELMALCDSLKNYLGEARACQALLCTVIVEQATNSDMRPV